MEPNKKARKLAHFEIGWWKAHHQKNKEGLIDNMARLYSLQFGISYVEAKKAVMLRVKATAWHDKAEEAEDIANQEQADVYWNKAEECLSRHFKLMEEVKELT